MKKYVTEYNFISDMASLENGFTVDGAILLFNYLEDLEENLGEEIIYDIVGLRCDYTEYDVTAYINEFGITEFNGVSFSVLDSYKFSDFYQEVILNSEYFISGNDEDCFIIRNH